MSRLSNELMMIRILENGRKYSIDELSNILEVSPRMIRMYKNDIELSGIDIESIRGKYGGYIINNNVFSKRFSKYDVQLLNNIRNILNSNDYQFMNEFDLLLNKVTNSVTSTKIQNGNFTNISDKNIYNIISKGISENLKVKIDYLSLTGEINSRIIHPCHIFNYNDELYVAAFCELREEIRHFEFSRIKKIKLLDLKFT